MKRDVDDVLVDADAVELCSAIDRSPCFELDNNDGIVGTRIRIRTWIKAKESVERIFSSF